MSAKPCCVLVDDDGDFRALMEQMVSRVAPDFEIVSFSSGLDAVEFLKRKRVNLIVTDFQMPVFDGLQLTAAVRSIDSTVPVVIVSGKEIRDDVTKSGANAFLWKAALLTELGPTLERVGVHTTRSGLGWMSTSFPTPALSEPVHVSQSNRA